MLGQVTRTRSMKPARAKDPAGSPMVVNDQPNLFFPFRRIGTRRDTGRILKNFKANKTKTDGKTGLSRGGQNWDMIFKEFDNDVKLDDTSWDKIIPAHQLAEVKVEDENKQLKANTREPAAEGETRRSLKPYSAIIPGLRTTMPLEFGHGLTLPRPNEPITPHRSTYRLPNCGLRTAHYTISQDHTSGQEAHKDSLLANFGNRRRTDKPSISLAGSKLSQHSPTLLSRLANSNGVVAHNGVPSTLGIPQDDPHFFGRWQPIGSKMPEDTVSIPQQTATTKHKERKDRVEFEWDDIKVESIMHKERGRQIPSHRRIYVDSIQESSLIDVLNTSDDRPPASLERQCDSCDRTDSREWKRGPNGAATLCNACGFQYAVWERNRILGRGYN